MRRAPSPGLLLLPLALVIPSCAEPPPPVAPAPIVIPPPLPPLPAAPPPLLAVPRAEASPRSTRPPAAPEVPRLRSEGKRHALQRTAEGVLVLSEDRGVIGFVKGPGEIRWAGFVGDDAVVIAVGDALLRAATPDDAIAGRFEPLAKIDAAATTMASAGKVIVAAAPGEGGAFHVSRDGGKRFTAEKRPPGKIDSLTVRSDGVIVLAIEREKFTGDYGSKGVRAEVHASRGPGAWAKGPTAVGLGGPVIAHQGDEVSVSDAKKGPNGHHPHLGLDARGKWIPIDSPSNDWLRFTWADERVELDVITARPGFPRPTKGDGMGLGGLLGRLLGDVACRGAACLAHRSPVTSTPIARAFHDGVCAKEHSVTREETVDVHDGPHDPRGHSEKYVVHECAADGPAQRPSTLMLRTGAIHVAKLPATCASGRVIATDRAAFVACSAKHRGRAALLHVAPTGAATEVLAGLPADLDVLGAESASDGTTVVLADKATWLCRTDAPACAAVAREGLLAARPVPGGRALVARRGATDHDLVIELLGEPGAVPFALKVQDNVLEIELTPDGYVRLWTSPSLTTFEPQKSDRLLVRTDGLLIADRSPP